MNLLAGRKQSEVLSCGLAVNGKLIIADYRFEGFGLPE